MDIDDSEAPRGPSQHVFGLILAVLGLILIGFGIWALAGAIYITWELFKDPDSISYFAKYFIETAKITARLSNDGEGFAHLLSWLSVVLLLLVLGKLGDWSITSGAQLLTLGKSRRVD